MNTKMYHALLIGALIHMPLAMIQAQTSAPVGEIEASVSTSFGTYTPYTIPTYRLTVGLDEPTISSDFANVSTASGEFAWSDYFSAAERSTLRRNNFVARAEPIGSFAQAYAGNQDIELGSFVTVDAVLHGLRTTADEAYRQMERDQFAPNLSNLLATLAQSISGQLGGARSQASTQALTRLLAYTQTGQSLLDPSTSIDSRVKSMVTSEIAKIDAAQGRSASSIIPRLQINYAQFQPSGTLHDRSDAQELLPRPDMAQRSRS